MKLQKHYHQNKVCSYSIHIYNIHIIKRHKNSEGNIELPKQPEIRQTKSHNEGGLEPPISDPKLTSPVSHSENDELYNFEGTTQGDITTKGNNV